jgi:hypothetical protein
LIRTCDQSKQCTRPTSLSSHVRKVFAPHAGNPLCAGADSSTRVQEVLVAKFRAGRSLPDIAWPAAGHVAASGAVLAQPIQDDRRADSEAKNGAEGGYKHPRRIGADDVSNDCRTG